MTEFQKVDFQLLYEAEMSDANMAVDILENIQVISFLIVTGILIRMSHCYWLLQHQIEVGLWRKAKVPSIEEPVAKVPPIHHHGVELVDEDDYLIPSPKRVPSKVRNKVRRFPCSTSSFPSGPHSPLSVLDQSSRFAQI